VGTDRLLEFSEAYAPAATEREPVAARGRIPDDAAMEAASTGCREGQDEIVMRAWTTRRRCVYVYKTMTDPFTGRVTFFKVISGKMTAGATVQNYTRSEPESLAICMSCRGASRWRFLSYIRGPGRGGEAARDADRRHAGDKANELFIEPGRCLSRR